jgi:hypothetical protein
LGFIFNYEDKMGFMDISGGIILEALYEEITVAEGYFLLLEKKEKMGYYNLKSRKIFWAEDGFSSP